MESDITSYFHCKKCNSGNLAVGFTDYGLQAFCENCQLNVIRLELETDKTTVVQTPADPKFPAQVHKKD